MPCAISAGGAAGLALEETQFSRISGAGTAAGTGGAGLVLENGYNFSNIFFGLDLEVSPTCLSITFAHDGQNTFISPYFNCTTAVSATASTRNVLINPNFGGAVINRGPQSASIQVIGTGNRVPWQFPSVSSYTATGIDSGTALSSYNAPGASLAITLPVPAAVETGWWMGFATDNGKGMTVTAPSGYIVSGGKFLSSITLGAGNYEYVELVNDGSNFRVRTATRNTRIANGFEPRDWPGNWLYPSTSGYSATLADNGNVLSSFNASGGALTVTLPPPTALLPGWSMGFATDSNKALTVNVNGTAGGKLLWPGSGASATTLSLANTSQGAYEFLALQFDGDNFRVIDATPATAQALGMIGSAGISHWSFPATSAYSATPADDGNVISSFNSPLSYMAVTLPPTTAISMGWTIAIASDSNKAQAVQANGTSGGHILFPGSGATTTSVNLAPGNYEYLALQFDGDNFRVTAVTPATASLMGMTGAAFALNRWNFPSLATYSAAPSDSGNVLSSYNTSAGLTVTLPSTTAIPMGWIMGFASDNAKSMTVQVNGTSGGHILEPARGGISATSIEPRERAELRVSGVAIRRLEFPRRRDDPADAEHAGRPDHLRHAILELGRLQHRGAAIRFQLPLRLHRAQYLEAISLEQLLMPPESAARKPLTASYTWGQQGLEAQFATVFQPSQGIFSPGYPLAPPGARAGAAVGFSGRRQHDLHAARL